MNKPNDGFDDYMQALYDAAKSEDNYRSFK